MRSDKYKDFFKAEYLMGPNSLRLLEELLDTYPLPDNADKTVLDLGCGTGLTSFFIAKETGAKVFANDLWISAEDNLARFESWGAADKITPVHEDANCLHFEKEQFDAVISIDSYHYFAGKAGFFTEKILPYIKKGGMALIAVPGMKTEYDGRSEELLTDWLHDEAYMFQSPLFWKKIIGTHKEIEEVRTWEMDCFDLAWREWFAVSHEYAIDDYANYETRIKPYTCFVGMLIRKK